MKPNKANLNERRMADAWATLAAQADSPEGIAPNANRIAYSDPEFMTRRETRGIRLQLEMMKADAGQIEAGVEHTIVVFGGARFCSPEDAALSLAAAKKSGDVEQLAKAERLVRNSPYYTQAREFGRLVGEYSKAQSADQKLFICTGGGPGVMEATNRGADDAGAPSVGLSIVLPHEQNSNRFVTPELSFKFHYFAIRKMHFMMRAKALVAFPGGFGTLDELFEILTLVQTGKVKPVPIFLYGSAYWKKVINFEALAEEGAISHKDLQLFRYVDDAQSTWDAIRKFYGLG